MEWVALTLSIIGTLFVTAKRWHGQALYLISNVIWLYFAFTKGITSQIWLFAFYTITTVIGTVVWYVQSKYGGEIHFGDTTIANYCEMAQDNILLQEEIAMLRGQVDVLDGRLREVDPEYTRFNPFPRFKN